MKYLRENFTKLVILVVLVIVLFYMFGYFRPDYSEKLRKSNEKLKKHESLIIGLKSDIDRQEALKRALRTEKQKLQGEINELILSPIKTPGEFETIYVPMTEYKKVYCLDLALKDALIKYVKIDLKDTATSDSIIVKLKEVDEERNKEIEDLKKDRDFFYQRAKRSFFGFGFALGISYDPVASDVRYGVQVGVFYVFKIKLFK